MLTLVWLVLEPVFVLVDGPRKSLFLGWVDECECRQDNEASGDVVDVAVECAKLYADDKHAGSY